MSSKKTLFENFNLLILRSPVLDNSEISAISQILDKHKVPLHVQDITDDLTEEFFVSKKYSHIVSNTSDFSLYKKTQEKLIPVVTSLFIHKVEELKRQPSIRPFSPNPEHVLKDVTVCVGGLPDSDKEVIYGAVRALGGSFSETLNRFVTHLISTDLEEDCCIVVRTIDEPKITIVVPNWIDDCIKLRKRLNEKPYLLVQDEEELQVSLTKAASDVKQQQKRQHNEALLAGKIIYLGSDLQLSQTKSSMDVKSWMENAGAKFTKDILQANTYIGRYREGLEYHTAMKNNLLVASLYWIFWMEEHQRSISPYEKLLHHPWVRDGLPDMKNFIISSTNYTGDARQYVTKLVEALGAKFTTTLNRKNTHLIAATNYGKKYDSAIKWGTVQVINHLWLEESYADWSLKPTSHSRYSFYPRLFDISEIIGETPLKINVLKKFYESGEIDQTTNHIEDSQDEDHLDLVTSKEKLEILDKARELQRTSCQNSPVKKQNEKLHVSEQMEVDEELTPTAAQTTESINMTEQENVPTAPLQTQGTDVCPIDSSLGQNANTIPLKQTSINLPNDQTSVLPPAAENQKENHVVFTPELSKPPSRTPTPTRVRTVRKAKNQASEKLQASMEELNVFEKQVKSKDIPLLPEEVEEKKKRTKVEKIAKELKRARESGTEEELKANCTVEEIKILEEIEARAKPTKRAKKEVASAPSPVPTRTQTTRYNINAICTGWDISFNRTEMSLFANLGIRLYKDLKPSINTIASPKMMRTEKFLSSLSYNIKYIITPEFLKNVLTQYKSNLNDTASLPEANEYSLTKKNPESVKENTSVGLETLLERCQANYQNKDKIFLGLTFNIISKLPGGVEPISKILKSHGVKDIKVFKTLKDLKNLASLKYTKNKAAGEKDSFVFLSNDKGFNEKLKNLLETEGDTYPITGKIVEWDWVVSAIFNMEIPETHVTYEC